MDKIDDAIQKAAPVEVKLVQIQVNIGSTGRPVMLAMPFDLSDRELLEFTSWVTSPDGLRAALPPPSPLIVARGIPQIPRVS